MCCNKHHGHAAAPCIHLQSSICEEGEEEEEEEEEGAADELSSLRLTESFSCWHPQPEESSPVRRLQSGSEPSVCTELSLAAVGPSLDEVGAGCWLARRLSVCAFVLGGRVQRDVHCCLQMRDANAQIFVSRGSHLYCWQHPRTVLQG